MHYVQQEVKATPAMMREGHGEKDVIMRFLYFMRDIRSRKMFAVMRRFCRGHVLDVGGFDFIITAIKKNIPFERWTTIEPSGQRMPPVEDPRFTFIQGDGCDMPQFPANHFDSALCIQVLEHVFEPIRMVAEIGRVLKPGGIAIFLIPQTSVVHFAPFFFGNYSRYWIQEAVQRAGMEIVELHPLGGRWSSFASNLVYFFLQSWRVNGNSDSAIHRNILFYLLYPFMVVTAALLIPLFLLFSLGDLQEEPNNHLVVARKRAG